jgi:hypothetical protein
VGWSLVSVASLLVEELDDASEEDEEVLALPSPLALEEAPQAASEKDAAASARPMKPRLVMAAYAVRTLFSPNVSWLSWSMGAPIVVGSVSAITIPATCERPVGRE